MKRDRRDSTSGRPTEFGFSLPGRGPVAEHPDTLVRLARKADALGLSYVTVSDHIVLPTRNSSPYPYSPTGEFPGGSRQSFLEPLSLMGWLLATTRHIRVATSVLVIPYRNPVLAAKQIAMLDVLSGGRVIVGCGVGWWPEEFQALGAPPFSDRGAVTDEYLRVMKELWTADEPRFAGKYYQVADVSFLPKPVQRPHPPLWIGGHTARAIRRAGELGDAWHPIALRAPVELTPAQYAERAREVREHAVRAGRSPTAVTLTLRAPLDLWPARGAASRGAAADPAAYLRGPASKIVADIRAYQRAGVRVFVFDFPQQDAKLMVRTMERFAAEVRPKVTRVP